MMKKHSDVFEFTTDSQTLKKAVFNKKVAGLLGVEGGHQLGNSLAVLRLYYEMGVRYMTLTHFCNNAFADSSGYVESPKPTHNGLSDLGVSLIGEMNRLGMMIDLSHTSDSSVIRAIQLTKAPSYGRIHLRAGWWISRAMCRIIYCK